VPRRQAQNSPEEDWQPVGGTSPGAGGPDARAGTGTDEPDTEEWMIPAAAQAQPAKPEPKAKGTAAKRSPKSSPARAEPAPAAAEPPEASEEGPGDDSELVALRQRLEEAERRAQIAERRVEEAAEREREAREREAREKQAREREAREKQAREREAREKAEKTRKSAKSAGSRKSAPEPATPNGQRLDINSARFEDLRSMGLTVAQSARLIAIRDVRNGFESLKELDDLDDLPQDLVSTLKQHLRV